MFVLVLDVFVLLVLDGGMFELLCSIFEKDNIVVLMSGSSCVEIHEGIPEGGTMGTLTYVCLPDDLVRVLLAAGLGVGIDITIPPAWQSHTFVGAGTPDRELVDSLEAALRTKAALPSAAELSGSATLEASALAAMDRVATRRIVAVLHADDPVFMASSAGVLQRAIDVVGAWSESHAAVFHTGPNKSVIMVSCDANVVDRTYIGFYFQGSSNAERVPLTRVNLHKWLGLQWSARMELKCAMEERLRIASYHMATLSGLVNARALPLHIAVNIFGGKVEGVFEGCRWILLMEQNAEIRLTSLYEGWARALLGADVWRNAAVAQGELGWHIPPYAKLVRAAALRLARLQSLPEDDLYRFVSDYAGRVSERSWTFTCRKTLREWGIPEFSDTGPGIHLSAYKDQVTAIVAARCLPSRQAQCTRHVAPIPYLDLTPTHSRVLDLVAASQLQWHVTIAVRSWCRMRAGLICVGHRHGNRSSARLQNCVFCDAMVRNPLKHVLGVCPIWSRQRQGFSSHCPGADVSADVITLAVLRAVPPSDGFSCAALWADEIDRAASTAWACFATRQNVHIHTVSGRRSL